MGIFELIALIGALAWLPQLIRLLRAWLKQPEVRIIAEQRIELGFTIFGPLLNIRVAFAVKNKDIVISGVKIHLRHDSGEDKVFSWHSIVQNMLQMNYPSTGPIPFEKELSVLAIKLSPDEVERRIRFHEPSFQTKKETFEEAVTKTLIYMQASGKDDFKPILNSEEMQELYSFIRQSFNWKSGTYQLKFEVDSPQPFALKDYNYEFTLTPTEIEHLGRNKDLIEKSYEYQFFPSTEPDSQAQLSWAWRYPAMKKQPD